MYLFSLRQKQQQDPFKNTFISQVKQWVINLGRREPGVQKQEQTSTCIGHKLRRRSLKTAFPHIWFLPVSTHIKCSK